ncbi:MAG: ACT domain-containing protein [Clostridia bacterium]
MDEKYLIIEKSVLPDIYQKVLLVNNMLQKGEADNTSEATKKAGISRSVYYKYKDSVFSYKKRETSEVLTVQVTLLDKPGVLVNLLTAFYKVNANILTVNQNIPVRGKAFVSLSAKIENITVELDELLSIIKNIDGLVKIESLSDE